MPLERPIVLLLASCLLAGCATTGSMLLPAQRKVGEDPPLGSRSTVEVGEALYSLYDYSESKSARLLSGYDHPYALGRISVTPSDGMPQRANPNRLIAEFCTARKTYRDPLVGPYDVTCFLDVNTDGVFDKVKVPSIKFGSSSEVKQAAAYRVVSDLQDGFRRELVYSGLDGSTLRLVYREFNQGLARPAFSQDLTYQLGEAGTTTISFRGARIDIHQAGNQGITYTVVKGMDP